MKKLEIREQRQAEGRVRLDIAGEINIHTSPELRERLKPLLSDENKAVHVALDDVTFMDSSGIATLIEGLQWSRRTGGRFRISGLSESVRDVFSLAKLDDVFDIDDGEF